MLCKKKDATHVLSEKKLVIDRTNCNIKSFMSLTIWFIKMAVIFLPQRTNVYSLFFGHILLLAV